MDAEQLGQALYDKMEAEFNEYKSNLLQQTPEQIIKQAYEYTVREDILMAAEYIELSVEQLEALLSSPSPLADILDQFQNTETNYMDTLRDCIENRASDLLTAQRRATPLYQYNAKYAREHDELDLFQASKKANIACRDAIDTAIRKGSNGEYFIPDVKGVLAEFGPERVTHVLAATLRDRNYDQRFSGDTMEWAASVPMFDTGTRHTDYALNSHSTLLDSFVGMVRKELDAVSEQQADKKPSIKEQLAVKPVPGDPPVKPREEVR